MGYNLRSKSMTRRHSHGTNTPGRQILKNSTDYSAAKTKSGVKKWINKAACIAAAIAISLSANNISAQNNINLNNSTESDYVNLNKTEIQIGSNNQNSGLGMPSQSQAQSVPDTTYATGVFNLVKKNTNNDIGRYLDITMVPLTVQMTAPDTITDHMAGSGYYLFKLPVFIDTTTIDTTSNISQSHKLESDVFPTVGSELNVFLDEYVSQATVSVFDITGKQVELAEFSGDNTYLNLSDLSNGMYVYSVVSDDQVSTGKFMKTDSPIFGPQSRPASSDGSFSQDKPIAQGSKGLYSADYKISFVDTSQGPGVGFKPLDTIVNLSDGDNGLLMFFMTPMEDLPTYRVVSGKIRDIYTEDPLDSVKVRWKNFNNGIVLDSTWTDSNGNFETGQIPMNTKLLIEYGDIVTHMSRRHSFQLNKFASLPTNYDDTLLTNFDLMLPPIKIPMPKTINDTITPDSIYLTPTDVASDDNSPWDGYRFIQIEERYRGPPSSDDIEVAMGRGILINLDPSWSSSEITSFYDKLAEGDSLFYGDKPSPWVVVPQNFNALVNNNIPNINTLYNKDTNYYPGQIGFNIRSGNPQVDLRYASTGLYGGSLVIGGVIFIGGGSVSFLKEMYGRRQHLQPVTSETSYMNGIGSYPTLVDRAAYQLLETNNKHRHLTGYDKFTLEGLYIDLAGSNNMPSK